jgi:predicted signal transduction protein with EAL and GGDEF domain
MSLHAWAGTNLRFFCVRWDPRKPISSEPRNSVEHCPHRGVGHITVRISASCGLARYPQTGETAVQLLEHADNALYHVKRHRRRGVALFSNEIDNHLRRRSRIEQTLRLAPVQDSVYVMFQPIVDLFTFRIRSFEALARWTDERLGPVPPMEFISVAEQAGFIGDLTYKLFNTAIKHAKAWR